MRIKLSHIYIMFGPHKTRLLVGTWPCVCGIFKYADCEKKREGLPRSDLNSCVDMPAVDMVDQPHVFARISLIFWAGIRGQVARRSEFTTGRTATSAPSTAA